MRTEGNHFLSSLTAVTPAGCSVLVVHGDQASIVSHRLSLGEAPEAYQHFDARDNGWTKVALKPTQ